jgi:phosphatidylserine decarboxylase
MNLHNVHVNRSPIDGKIIKKEYRKGSFSPAFSKDSDKNEQLKWWIKSDKFIIQINQISGAIVRRIVSYKEQNDLVRRGERIGMIRFGSRVDVTIPNNYKILIGEGEKVFAGKTVIAMKK